MAQIYLLFPILISFLVSLLLVPFWIRKAREIGLVWRDMNKEPNGKVAGAGGIIAVLAFIIGVLVFIAYRTFILNTSDFLIEMFAMLSAVFFLAGIGLVDDLFGWVKGGLSKRSRIVLIILAAIPLMVINAGRSEIGIPFLGLVDLGLIYPLIIIPIGIVGAAAGFNFLAGFNGLEAGQGILILVALGIVAFLTGSSWLAVIALLMAAALLGFLIYNYYPAKVFPGDALTLTLGGLIAIIAIFGNFEKIAVFFFIPYILEIILKFRGKLRKYSFGKPDGEGGLDLRYDKVYSLNHVAILVMKKLRIKATERKVVSLIWAFQIIVILIGFAVFGKGIF